MIDMIETTRHQGRLIFLEACLIPISQPYSRSAEASSADIRKRVAMELAPSIASNKEGHW